MEVKLRPYQQIASEFIQKQSAGLFLDVGLGKTLTALHASMEIKAQRILILAPKSLLLQWEAEIEKFYPLLPRLVLSGSKNEKYEVWKKYQFRLGGCLITNYETMRAYVEQLKTIPWDVIICDEAQRIANPRTKTYKALRMLHTNRAWALTGTPISNSLIDAYGIFNWIKPNMFGNYYAFQANYCVKNNFNHVVGYRNVDHLQKVIAPHFIRFTADEVASDLPDKIITDIPIELSDKERKLYDQIKHEIYHELTGGRADKISLASLGNAIVQLIRLQQVVGHASLIGSDHEGSSKLEVLKEKLEEITINNDKVIVFTKFAKMAHIIQKELGYGARLIDGQTEASHRAIHIKEINDPFSATKILIMTNAGAEGLNIQGANHIIFYDFDWSLSKQVQKIGRIHRLGQEKTCFIWRLVATKTIDEYILRKVEKKQDMSERLLTTTDIEEILR